MATKLRKGNCFGRPLEVSVENGRLVIAIGVRTLAHAVTYADWVNPWRDIEDHDAGGDYRRDFVITDAPAFAKDVMHAMLDEREDGSTPISDFLDKMTLAAVEDGSIATDDAPKGGIPHGQTDPRETWAAATASSRPQERA